MNNIFQILTPLLHVSAQYMCHPQGAQKFLMKYVYATSWVPRIVRVDVEYRVSSQLKIPTLNIHSHYPQLL
jgi:hypothetical protein